MKRVAERQLAKDDGDDDDIQEVSGEGFKKADDKVLAGRKIRALPKRGSNSTLGSTTSVTPNNSEPESKPRFTGFTGFGSAASTPSSSFSFTPPKSAMTSSGSLGENASANSVSSAASNATKAFASFLGTSPQANIPASAPARPVVSNEPEAAEVAYYLALRGLNESFLLAAKQAVEKDPFFDLGMLFSQYKNHRTSEESKHNTNSRPVTSAPSTIKEPVAKPETLKAPTAMPMPPTNFAGFGGFGSGPSHKTSASSASGFVPTITPSTETKPGFSLPASTSNAGSGFSFVKSAAAEINNNSEKAPASAGFSFAKPASIEPATKAPSSSGFSFGSSPFGAKPLSSSQGASTEKEKETPSTTFGASSTFGSSVFGATSSSFGSTAPSSATPSSTPSTVFGKSTTPATGGFGFMSKPGSAGSIGNPVGFGFGSSTKADGSENKATFASSGFSFAKPADTAETSTQEVTSSTSEEVNGNAIGPDVESTNPIALSGPNPHDTEGEGEENEETTHEVKAKAFKLKTDDEGKALWAEMGVGIFRLKKHKTTESRRMLMRNSSTGKVIINSNLYSGLSPVVTKKALKFIAHDEESNAHTYTLRVGTEAAAGDLKDAFEREIVFVKAKNGD